MEDVAAEGMAEVNFMWQAWGYGCILALRTCYRGNALACRRASFCVAGARKCVRADVTVAGAGYPLICEYVLAGRVSQNGVGGCEQQRLWGMRSSGC